MDGDEDSENATKKLKVQKSCSKHICAAMLVWFVQATASSSGPSSERL